VAVNSCPNSCRAIGTHLQLHVLSHSLEEKLLKDEQQGLLKESTAVTLIFICLTCTPCIVPAFASPHRLIRPPITCTGLLKNQQQILLKESTAGILMYIWITGFLLAASN